MVRKEILEISKFTYIDNDDLWEKVYRLLLTLKNITKEETEFLLSFSDDIDNSRWFEIYHDELSLFLIKIWEKYKLID